MTCIFIILDGRHNHKSYEKQVMKKQSKAHVQGPCQPWSAFATIFTDLHGPNHFAPCWWTFEGFFTFVGLEIQNFPQRGLAPPHPAPTVVLNLQGACLWARGAHWRPWPQQVIIMNNHTNPGSGSVFTECPFNKDGIFGNSGKICNIARWLSLGVVPTSMKLFPTLQPSQMNCYTM